MGFGRGGRAVCERVAPKIGVEAWVLDDTGFPKDGKRSPGVKRQYSGTLGKIGNCQIGVSLHAVGQRGTVALGWALYLPQEWCEDAERRSRAKIPAEVVFKTKPELGVALVERAAGWEIPAAPVLGDQAYGDNTRFVFVRVRAAHRWHKGLAEEPREEWLIAEWPAGRDEPTDYWISNLPADTTPQRLARLARLRWKIELVLGEAGQHAVVFGERGVGKTSLVSVVGDIFAGGSFLFVRRRIFALRALSQRGSAPVPS